MAEKGLVLVTGAAGFIGRALVAHLKAAGWPVRAQVRRGGTPLPAGLAAGLERVVEVDDLARVEARERLCSGAASIVHLAGRAHTGSADGDGFFHHNLDATVALARAAGRSRVKKFIFLSSIKVNGEGVAAARQLRPYTAADRPRPEGAYAVSKWRAEQELAKIFPAGGPVDLVIIRPPLVYGKGAAGNLAGLKRWLDLGLVLPVSRPPSQRSLVSRQRLVGVIAEALTAARGSRLLLPRDPRDWSLDELAGLLAAGPAPRLLPVPAPLLRAGLGLLGKREVYRKLYGSLLVADGGLNK